MKNLNGSQGWKRFKKGNSFVPLSLSFLMVCSAIPLSVPRAFAGASIAQQISQPGQAVTAVRRTVPVNNQAQVQRKVRKVAAKDPIKSDPILKKLLNFLDPINIKNTFASKLAQTFGSFADAVGQVTQDGAMGLAKFIVGGLKTKVDANKLAPLLQNAKVITKPDQVPLYDDLFAKEGINIQPAGIIFSDEGTLNQFISLIGFGGGVLGMVLDSIEFKAKHLLGSTGLLLTVDDPDIIHHEMGHFAHSIFMQENKYNFSVYYRGAQAWDNLVFDEQLAEFRPRVVKEIDPLIRQSCASDPDPDQCFRDQAKYMEPDVADAMVQYWQYWQGGPSRIAKIGAALIARLHTFLSSPIIERILFHAKGMADFLQWLKVSDATLELIRKWVV